MSSLEPAETHRPGTQERGTAAPEPGDGALSWRPSRPAPLRPWRRPNLATASLGQGAGGEAGTWPAAAGPSGTPPRPLPAGRRAPAPPPPPHAPAARPTSTPGPRLRPHRRGKDRAQGRPVRPLGGGRTRCSLGTGRGGRGLAARVPRGPGRGQVPGGGTRARVKPGDQAQGGRWEAGAPGPGGGPGPRPGRRQPGRRRRRALGLGAVVISSRAAPAELPLKCRAVRPPPPGRWQAQGSSAVRSKA